MDKKLALGVCYYPEQWPDEMWEPDLREMRRLGLRYVRFGEFAWSHLEPASGQLWWDGFDRILDLMSKYQLQAVLGTPTAAPPRWLIDQHPDILGVDPQGQVRDFGSRRHYCFSSPAYREAASRIVTLLADRYGAHAAVAGWQVDNEYGCHETVRCGCERCRTAFQSWLLIRYGTIEQLNQAWGTSFWSQTYQRFDQVGLPLGTVTQANPSQRLDYYRFASHQVCDFNRLQVDLIRPRSDGRFITHNGMGFFTDLDAFALSLDLDLAAWDSYPLGFTEYAPLTDEVRQHYARTGHPDVAAFNHDLYRSIGRGRFWVMEQQPGPVNWAPHNPSPAPGMVRLWSWEAFAHGAETVSYFRWRQASFGQEQMHAGLYRVDNVADVGAREVQAVSLELPVEPPAAPQTAAVALVFDYEACWTLAIEPQGASFDYLDLVFTWYRSLRLLGLDVDIVARQTDFSPYRLVLVPTLPMLSTDDVERLRSTQSTVLFGPRCGSKTSTFHIPAELPPGPLQAVLPVKVVRVESLRPGLVDSLQWGGRSYAVTRWKEWLETLLVAEAEFGDGRPALVRADRLCYLGFWPAEEFLLDWLEAECQKLAIDTVRLPADLRLRRRDGIQYAFNYGGTPVQIPGRSTREFVLGGSEVPPYSLSAWRSGTGSVLASVKAGLLGD